MDNRPRGPLDLLRNKASIYLRFVAWTLLLAVWELCYRSEFVSTLLFPGPVAVFRALITWAEDGTLLSDVLASLGRVGSGLVLGGTLGLGVGLVSGRIHWLSESMGAVVNALRAVPPVAIVPLAILWLGISESSKIFLVGWGAFFPVWLNTHLGVSRVDRTVEWSARSLGAVGLPFVWKVILPAALPQILAGVRLGIGIAYICVFVAELAGAHQGVGFRIATAHLVFRTDLMLAGLVVLAILGALTDAAFVRLVRTITPWLSLP